MQDSPTRAFWITGPMQGELRETPLPRRGSAEVRVHTLFSAISRGTESLVWRGAVPKSEHERMPRPFRKARSLGR